MSLHGITQNWEDSLVSTPVGIGKAPLSLPLSEVVRRRGTALSCNTSLAVEMMVGMALCGQQAGRESSLEGPDCRHWGRFLAKAPPISLHSGMKVERLLGRVGDLPCLLNTYLNTLCTPLIGKL